MRGKSMALILVALACGLVATIGVSQVMKENAQTDNAPTGPIVVTKTNMDIGDAIAGEKVVVEQWPLERIPPGAVTTVEELEGKFARQYMFPGEPLLTGKVMDDKTDSSTTIPVGYRVAAVKVNEESAVANLINPGDHVDVIAFIKSRSSGDQVRSKTILQDIRVFAVNSETTRGQDVGEDGRIDANTVSLLVKPKQVQMLVLAEQLGKLELSLRHPDEQVDESEESTTVDDLLGNSNSDSKASSTAGWLEMLKPKDAKSNSAIPQGVPAGEEAFEMVVMGPDQAVRFQWKDEDKLPEIVGQQQIGVAAPATTPAGAPGAPATPTIPTDLPPGLVPSPVPPSPVAPESAFLGEA